MSQRKATTQTRTTKTRRHGGSAGLQSTNSPPLAPPSIVQSPRESASFARASWDPMEGAEQYDKAMSLSDTDSSDYYAVHTLPGREMVQLVRAQNAANEFPGFGGLPYSSLAGVRESSREEQGYPNNQEHVEGSGKFVDANKLQRCRLEGLDSRGYAGCLIVSDKTVIAPWKEAKNDIDGTTTVREHSGLESGTRLLSVEAFRIMAEMDARKSQNQTR